MDRSTSFTSEFRFPLPESSICYCGKLTVVRTTWKPTNPGRRFECCCDTACQHFRWVDPEMCPRSKVIIPGLLRKINNLERDLKVAEEKVKRILRVILIVLCVVILVVAVVVGMAKMKV